MRIQVSAIQVTHEHDLLLSFRSAKQFSRENLVDSVESLTPSECDDRFLALQDGIDLALHRAKVWSKYAKDVISYIEKRAHFGKLLQKAIQLRCSRLTKCPLPLPRHCHCVDFLSRMLQKRSTPVT